MSIPVGAVNKSEVAHLMARIDAAYEASLQGLQGLAQGTAQHEIINRRMAALEKVATEAKIDIETIIFLADTAEQMYRTKP